MKEFRIVNGKRIHPYVRKRTAKRTNRIVATVSPVESSFEPPYKLTLFKDIADERDFSSKTKPSLFKTSSNFSVPLGIDYTSGMSSVKNQGGLGSCVAFATAAMKEWQEKKEHKLEVKEGKKDTRKDKGYNYSEAWIYWNCKKIDAWPNAEGTSIRDAMKVLHKIGVPTEKAWPYSDDKLNIGEPKRWASLVARWAQIGEYYRVDYAEDAKIALAQDGPFVMGIPCFYDFFFVKGDGTVPDPADGEKNYGGHAVCVVGYDDNRKLLKFKNSWSKFWGQGGYGYISYDYFDKYSWGSWACKDISVTREMLKGDRILE